MGTVNMKFGKDAVQTIRLALEDGEDREVSEDEVQRAIEFLKDGDKEIDEMYRKWVLSGAYKIRWNDEEEALDIGRR